MGAGEVARTVAEFRCPFCAVKVAITDGVDGVQPRHAEPPCDVFAALDTPKYMRSVAVLRRLSARRSGGQS